LGAPALRAMVLTNIPSRVPTIRVPTRKMMISRMRIRNEFGLDATVLVVVVLTLAIWSAAARPRQAISFRGGGSVRKNVSTPSMS
jgi:endonuclease/exonuclease/phosphatase family metal-dependent hydrolase